MATSQTPPAPGGNLKYAVIGILFLLLAGGGLFWVLKCSGGGPPPPPLPDAGPGIRRPTALGTQQLEIPEPEPDGGPPFDAGGPRIRYITRYVAGDWECSGDIPQATVRSTLAEYKTQMRNCYERRLKVNNTLQGSVSLSLKVSASGSVVGVQVGGSLRDNDVFSCVRTIAQSMRFPAPTGGACAVVRVPYNFTPHTE